MMQKQKKVTRGLRYDAELNNRIEAATKQGGFSCSSAFIRAAIERELAGRESGVDVAEQRIAASLAKTFLTCVPEPPRDVHRPSRRPRQSALRPISQERG